MSDRDKNQLSSYIKKGNATEIENIVNIKVHVNCTLPNDYQTPLELAIEYDQPQIAKLLISKGANPNIWHGENPLTSSITKNRWELAKHLIQIGANTCRTSWFHNTPLSAAVKQGNIEIVQLLLVNGAEFTILSGLLTAIEHNNVDIVRLLLKKEAEIINKYKKGDGYTPLIKSLKVSAVNSEIVEELLKNGADVNLSTKAGEPLKLLVMNAINNAQIVTLLIQYSAKTNYHDLISASIDHNNVKIFEYLIQNGADVNESDKNGEYPIMKAISSGNREMVKMLIENNVKLDVKDSEGDTPFIKSVRIADYYITKYLLKQKIDLNQKDENSKTGLEIALRNYDFQTFKLLTEAGADINLATDSIQEMIDVFPDLELFITRIKSTKDENITEGLSGNEGSSTN